ncbi:MAG: hypothetical protein RL660_978 [Bacteroidota bacterium]|jgi:glycosyltransferase involved in cell wall biosynthesis
MQQKKYLLILPCFNERDSIAMLLTELQQYVSTTDIIDIVVVNDCSTDNTSAIARRFPNVVVLDCAVNLGIGGAVQTGYKYAVQQNYDFAIQMDGDGQHPPAELEKLIRAQAESAADLVIGSRFIEKQGFQSYGLRRVGIHYLRTLAKMLCGSHVLDITSGFRLMSRPCFTIAATQYPDDYPEPISLITFIRAKMQVVEVPVLMRERVAGTSSIKSLWQLFYMVKVSIAMLFSRIKTA